MSFIDMLFRWGHILFGIAWIGLLYYFNFVQTEYVKEADDTAKADVMQKLAPRALWWFRWAAMFTFLSGLVLLSLVSGRLTLEIILGATMGTLMMANMWLIIWPKQQIVIGLVSGDKAAAAPKAALASRTNTLFSIPMLYMMVASAHTSFGGIWNGGGMKMSALWIGIAIIALVEANAIWGKMNSALQSVNAVIASGLVLTVIMGGVVYYL